MKKINLLIVMFLCVLGLSSIQADEPSIVGRWAITYHPEQQSEWENYRLGILEISNTAMSFSELNILRPNGFEPEVMPITIKGNLLLVNDEQGFEYSLNGNSLTLDFDGKRYINAIKLVGLDEISGIYNCYIGFSENSLEILDDSNVLVTTMQGASYNQQPGKYIVSGKYFILTLNGASYSFEILENNAVLFGKTQGLHGAFVNLQQAY